MQMHNKGFFHWLFGFKFPFRIVSTGKYETMRADGYYLRLYRDRFTEKELKDRGSYS